MLPFRVRHFIGRTEGRKGEEVVIMTDLCGSPSPHYHPNLYVTAEYRQVGRSPHTIDKVLRAIGLARMWAETRARDLDKDLLVGNMLDASDVLDLTRFLGLPTKEQVAEYEAWKHGSNIAFLKSRRSEKRHWDEEAQRGPPATELGNRIRWVASYVEWHRRRRFDNRILIEADAHLNFSAVKAIAALRQRAPSNTFRSDDESKLEAPGPGLLMRIDAILHPESVQNPFTSQFVRWRNYLAWRLLFDTGARRGEVWAASTDSVLGERKRFAIRISKTIARTVPIIDTTAKVFEHFFTKFWLNLPEGCEAHRSGNLFTDERGKALTSGKFLNRVFSAVQEIIGPQQWTITPHTMRRAWNYVLSCKLDRLPEAQRLDPKQEAEIRKRLMGWSESSRMPELYNRRHIRERADKIAYDMMEELTTPPIEIEPK